MSFLGSGLSTCLGADPRAGTLICAGFFLLLGFGSLHAQPGTEFALFSAQLEVGLVLTDTGLGATSTQTRYGGTADQAFFTLPSLAVAMDRHLGHATRFHLQLDFQADPASQGAALPRGFAPLGSGTGGIPPGQGLGLNEVYLEFDEFSRGLGLKLGGIALPFQSWELGDRFREGLRTITPSAKNTLLERFRLLGMEFYPDKLPGLPGADLRLGLFLGGDKGTLLAGFVPILPSVGAMNDAVGQAGLTRSVTLSDNLGWYLDLESRPDPEASWGWRLGYLDNGGDDLHVPRGFLAGVSPSQDLRGWQGGLWKRRGRLQMQLETLEMVARNGLGPGRRNRMRASYLAAHWQLDGRNLLGLRLDQWRNRLDASAPGSTRGQAWTWSWRRETGPRTQLMLEWLRPFEEDAGNSGLQDRQDDLVQLRLRVGF